MESKSFQILTFSNFITSTNLREVWSLEMSLIYKIVSKISKQNEVNMQLLSKYFGPIALQLKTSQFCGSCHRNAMRCGFLGQSTRVQRSHYYCLSNFRFFHSTTKQSYVFQVLHKIRWILYIFVLGRLGGLGSKIHFGNFATLRMFLLFFSYFHRQNIYSVHCSVYSTWDI